MTRCRRVPPRAHSALTRLAALATVALALASPAHAVNYIYRMIDIPGATCVGLYGLNDHGVAVLYDCTTTQLKPYLWSSGTLTALPQHPLAGAGGTAPTGISNSGEIVGSYIDATGGQHGFTAVPSGTGYIWTTIDHPGAIPSTSLTGIALNAGESVGLAAATFDATASVTTGSVYRAGRSVVDTNPADVWQDFDGATDPVYGSQNQITAGASSTAYGINDLGMIVGGRFGSHTDAWIYQGGTSIPTCPLFSPTVSTLPPGCTPRVIRFTVPGAAQTTAGGISPAGDVVGWTVDPGGTSGHGFVRSTSGVIQVIDAVDPVSHTSYAGLTSVEAVNSLGQLGGEVFAPGTFAVNSDGARAFIATASTTVPANNCLQSSGGCDLSSGAIVHTIEGLSSAPGNVTETVCKVVPDPRISRYGTCTGHTLPVSQVCPGFGATVIPDYLCGGSGPANNGFAIALDVADAVDVIPGILVSNEENVDAVLGGATNAPCPQTTGTWGPRSGSVEGTVPEGNALLEMTSACGSSTPKSRGLSIYGIGLVLNANALPGSTLTAKLAGFASSKFDNLTTTINTANIVSTEVTTLSACVALSRDYLLRSEYACSARRIYKCDAQVTANARSFGSAPANPNPFGDVRARLANLYLTLYSRLLGNPPPRNWPVPAASVPVCPLDDWTPATAGDLNHDAVSNCADLAIVKAAFGTRIGHPGYDPRADVNGDGIVNIVDLSTVARTLPAGTVCH